jgi:hypothetical protein
VFSIFGKEPIRQKKLEKWITAQKKYLLADKHIHMARELGLNPDKFGQLNNHDQKL